LTLELGVSSTIDGQVCAGDVRRFRTGDERHHRRDLLRGRSTFNELLASPEQIPTNLLADRLKRLEKAGVLVRTPYQKHPVRYSYKLTQKGRDLRDVLEAVVQWSKKHIAGVRIFTDINRKMRGH
jgi:DNA-binding HxlR family transcriptional regulator